MKQSTSAAGWRLVLPMLRNDRAGAAAVEFVLIIPVFLLLVLGAAIFGLLFGVSHSLQQIAADVSRYAMVGIDASERETLVKRSITTSSDGYALIDPQHLGFRLSENAGWMTVTVTYDMSDYDIPEFVSDFWVKDGVLERSATVVLP